MSKSIGNGCRAYYWLQILERFFRSLIEPCFLQCKEGSQSRSRLILLKTQVLLY